MPEPFRFKTDERSSVTRDSSCESLSSKPFVFKVCRLQASLICVNTVATYMSTAIYQFLLP